LYVAVCVKFVTKFIESLDESTKSSPVKVEDAFRKFCKTAKGDDNRFVSKCCVFCPTVLMLIVVPSLKMLNCHWLKVG